MRNGVRSAAPLGGPGITVDVLAAADAVASLHVAIELVDDRYGGAYSAFGIPAIVADNAFHSGFVLGDAVRDWKALDLAALRGVRVRTAWLKHAGVGADVLGHPLNSLAWMANCRGRLGKRIDAGAVVLTGSLPVVYWHRPASGSRIEIETAWRTCARTELTLPARCAAEQRVRRKPSLDRVVAEGDVDDGLHCFER